MIRNVGDFALNERLDVNKNYGAVDFNEVIIEIMDLQDNLSVLDVACGNGHFTKQVKKRVKNGLVAGLDQSEILIETAKKTTEKQGLEIDFRVADATTLPYDNNSFDRVYCLYAIYHFPDISRALSEMLRVLETEQSKLVIVGPAENNNLELYKLHQKAGGKIISEMGRDIFEKSVKEYFNSTSIDFQFNVITNSITFPTVDAFFEYYQNTKLYLDNIEEKGKPEFLNRILSNLNERVQEDLTLTKRIGIFELWGSPH